MKLTIDRIEEEFVLCESLDKTIIKLPISLFPDHIKDGDLIHYENGIVSIDTLGTMLKKSKVEDRFKKLWKK